MEHEPHLSVKIHLSKTSYHIETSQLICFSAQLTGFYIMGIVTERYFQIEYFQIDFNLFFSIYLHFYKVNKTDFFLTLWVPFKYLSLFLECEHFELNINPICHEGRIPTPSSTPVNFVYHISLNNLINLIFSDCTFYRFINISAKFGRSSPGKFEARTFLSKTFSKCFASWSLKVFLSFNCLYLGLNYLKVVCTQFFRYLFEDWLFHLKTDLYFNNFWSAK